MSRLITLAALAALAVCVGCAPAYSADKLEPPSRVDAAGLNLPMFTGCYLGAVGGGTLFASGGASVAVGTLGGEAGCDLQRSKVVFGLRAGYDFGEGDNRFLSLGGRIGHTINPHALMYGTLGLMTSGTSPDLKNSILSAGVGLELYAFTPRSTIFIETAKDLKTFGDAREIGDAWTVKAGMRYRF